MPERLLEMLNNSAWIPFIGMHTGKATPLTTRLIESAILAAIPIIAGAIWLIPEMKAEIRLNAKINERVIDTYATNMSALTSEVKETRKNVNELKTNVEVLKNNLSRVESKTDRIDDIANTKVRSVEGRLDSLERSLR